MADGAGLPFDALWLVQCVPTFDARPDSKAFLRTPFCTMFASVGDRAGADDLLVGRNLDWHGDEAPVIVEVRPDTGHAFAQVGFPWNAGVFSGMNDAGLVVCAERMQTLGDPETDGAPVEFVLRDVLQQAGTLDDAVTQLEATGHLRGYHVLVACAADEEKEIASQARVLEFGSQVVTREPAEGFLLGAEPESKQVDEDARTRYSRIAESLTEEHIVASAKIRKALHDSASGQLGRARVWNDDTKHSIVFVPNARVFHVSFPKADGRPGEPVTVSVKGGAS